MFGRRFISMSALALAAAATPGLLQATTPPAAPKPDRRPHTGKKELARAAKRAAKGKP